MPVTSKDLSQRLSKRLANFKLKDSVIKALSERVLIDGMDIKKWDICIYGICIDYTTNRIPRLDSILSKLDVARIDIFPYGIIEWDHFVVHVGYNVDELAGVNGPGVGR